MSAATDMFTEIVHVRMLDEGVDVWRPVRARRLASDTYELASDPVPAEEVWEFAPGDHVKVANRHLSEGSASVTAKVAVSRVTAHRISAE